MKTASKTKTQKTKKAAGATPKPVDDVKKKVEVVSEESSAVEKESRDRYFEAVGRRKTATTRVRLYTKGTGVLVNGKDYKVYFPLPNLQKIIDDPLRKMKNLERFKITAHVSGGGVNAQAEAIRHGISRALVVFNTDFKKRLKRAGYLKRDPRRKERKKYGLKKSRKAPRWSKR